MPSSVIEMLAENIQPLPRRSGWHGGPTPLGALRGVTAEQAHWAPTPKRKSIWQLALHIAYWKYAVRRRLEASTRPVARSSVEPAAGPRFPRSPANWPAPPAAADRRAWIRDQVLLREEHERLLAAVRAVPAARLGTRPPGAKRWTYGELILGIATHDAYHTGQIQLLKRLWRERR